MLLLKEIEKIILDRNPCNFVCMAYIAHGNLEMFLSNAGIKELLIYLGMTVFTESFNKHIVSIYA